MFGEWLSKLNERERVVVFGGGTFLIVFFLFSVVYKVSNIRSNLTDEVMETREQFSQLDRLLKDYNYYKSIKSGEEEEISNLYKKLDIILIRHELKDKVANIKDSTNAIQKEYNKLTIEVTLNSVPLPSVMKMIYDIEVGKQMNGRVEHFSFKRPLAGKELFDVTIRLSSYSRIKKDA
ncbi:MAG: hypothetical protein H7A23_06405 [Leptospiraceae bacterium]|nr:hypothetical protein [Leptospiraceae bacterium]MCP5494170.1 hypothetical protein [Leptospiraceae bacterium]